MNSEDEINFNDGYWLENDGDYEFDSPALDFGLGNANSLSSSIPSQSLGYPSFPVDTLGEPLAGEEERQKEAAGPSRKELLAKALEENRKYRKHLEAILEKVSAGLETNQVWSHEENNRPLPPTLFSSRCPLSPHFVFVPAHFLTRFCFVQERRPSFIFMRGASFPVLHFLPCLWLMLDHDRNTREG